MYKFRYDCFKNKYGNSSRLLVTDFDSLMYEIKNKDDCVIIMSRTRFRVNLHSIVA